MYFDLKPKSKKSDLYNFKKELLELKEGVEKSRIILLLGPRRIGKSSVLRTFLNECESPSILIDTREMITLEGYINVRSFAILVGNKISAFISKNKKRTAKFVEALKKIDGISVSGYSVRISWDKRGKTALPSLLNELNNWAEHNNSKVILAFDEAQELRDLPFKLVSLFAHIYDYLDNLIIILTGSQVGLLYDFLKIEDAQSPLYGRALDEIKLRKLEREEAIDFLEKGFKQMKTKIDKNLIEESVNKLDGIIGWLTYFGWMVTRKKTKSIDKILNEASKLALNELEMFLRKSQAERRYTSILNSLALRPMKWSELKRSLEAKEGLEINSSNFTKLLNRLIKLSLIEKKGQLYKIIDPVLAYGLAQL